MNFKKVSRNIGIGVLFCVTLSVGFIIQIVSSDKIYSETENRALETFPSIDLTSLSKGNFQKLFESYTSDQFPNRSRWMKMKTSFDLKLGIRLIQDVYIGDDMLIQNSSFSEKENTGLQNAEGINQFKNKYVDVNFDFILVPNKIEIYKDRLPKGAESVNQTKIYMDFYNMLDENIKKIDVLSILNEHKEEYIFYKTDHHWTTLAAKYVADAYLEKDDIDYNIVTSNDHFKGTLSNKIAYYPYADVISLYFPKDDSVQYVVDYVDSNKKETTLYDIEKQTATDAYAVFFGGNHPIIKINTTSNENKRLLIFKDSYANCFIPFLLPYYSEIVVVDPRYYYDDVDQLMIEENITDVLFLYNMNTFFSDDSLSTLKEE